MVTVSLGRGPNPLALLSVDSTPFIVLHHRSQASHSRRDLNATSRLEPTINNAATTGCSKPLAAMLIPTVLYTADKMRFDFSVRTARHKFWRTNAYEITSAFLCPLTQRRQVFDLRNLTKHCCGYLPVVV